MIGRFRARILCPMNAAHIQVRLLAKFPSSNLEIFIIGDSQIRSNTLLVVPPVA